MQWSRTLFHLINNKARQKHQAKVVENHRPFELKRFAFGHQSRAGVQYEEEIAKQERRHADRTVHQRVAP